MSARSWFDHWLITTFFHVVVNGGIIAIASAFS